MWHPEERHTLITIVVRVHQQDDITFPDLFVELGPFLRKSRGINYGGCDIFRSTDAGRDRDLGKNWLDLGGDEDVLDERSTGSITLLAPNRNCVMERYTL